MSRVYRLFCLILTGGLDVKAQEAALRMNPDVVIATPGRLIDHLHNSPNFSLRNIEILVLDEADRYGVYIFKKYISCSKHAVLLFSRNSLQEGISYSNRSICVCLCWWVCLCKCATAWVCVLV